MVSTKTRSKKATVKWFRIFQDVKVLMLTGLMLLVESPPSLQTPPEKRQGNSTTTTTTELSPSQEASSFSSSPVWSASPISQTSTSLISTVQLLQNYSKEPHKLLQRPVLINQPTSNFNILSDSSDKAADTETPASVSKLHSVLQLENLSSSTETAQNSSSQSSENLNGYSHNRPKVRMKRNSIDADSNTHNNIKTARSKKKNPPNHCKPIPETVLWKRIDPSEYFNYYLTMQAKELKETNEPIQSAAKSTSASRAKKSGRKRNSLETHSKRITNSRSRRYSRRPNANSLRETDRGSDEVNLNLLELNKGSVKEQKRDDKLIRSKIRRQRLQPSVVDNGRASFDFDSSSLDDNEDLLDSATNTSANVNTPLPRQKGFSSKKKIREKRKRTQRRRDKDGSTSMSRERRETSTELLPNHHKGQLPNLLDKDISNLWHCNLESFWEEMPFGVYPQYVKNGRCTRRRCWDGFHHCVERRYAVNIMRKNVGLCNPLPLVSDEPNVTTTLEESWTLDHHDVVVACECSKPTAAGVYHRTTKHKHSSAETSITQQSPQENASITQHRRTEGPP